MLVEVLGSAASVHAITYAVTVRHELSVYNLAWASFVTIVTSLEMTQHPMSAFKAIRLLIVQL